MKGKTKTSSNGSKWGRMARGFALLAMALLLAGGVIAGRAEAVVALNFNGESWVGTEANVQDLGIAGDAPRTIEAWAYTREFTGEGTVFSIGERGTDGADWFLLEMGSPDDWNAAYHGMPGQFSYPSHQQWVHFAMVYTGSEAITYANGEEVVRNEYDLNTTADRPFRIAGGWPGRDEAFDGMITEVRIWDYDRSQEAIAADMNRRMRGEEDGLVGYWPFDEGEGDTAHDQSGNDYHGTFMGSPEWVEVEDLALDPQIVETAPSTYTRVAPEESMELGPVLVHEDYEEDATFQWSFEGEELEGETGPGLFIDDATVEQAGTYTVVVNHPELQTPQEFEISVRVFEAQAPAAGVVGLGMLTLALAGGAAYSIRRMRR